MLASTVIIEGNTGTDIRVHAGAAGRPAVADLLVIVDRRGRDRHGTWTERTPTTHRVVAYGSLARNLAASIGKGDRILVVGHIVTDAWQDESTGETRTAVKVIADAAGPSLRWTTATPQKTTDQGSPNL